MTGTQTSFTEPKGIDLGLGFCALYPASKKGFVVSLKSYLKDEKQILYEGPFLVSKFSDLKFLDPLSELKVYLFWSLGE